MTVPKTTRGSHKQCKERLKEAPRRESTYLDRRIDPDFSILASDSSEIPTRKLVRQVMKAMKTAIEIEKDLMEDETSDGDQIRRLLGRRTIKMRTRNKSNQDG